MARPIAEFRRPEIVAAMRRVLEKSGLSMPSNDEIAVEAGMSRQLIRHYFPKPEDMPVELAKALVLEYTSLLSQGVVYAGTVSRLDIFLDFYFCQTPSDGPQKPADDSVYDALMTLSVDNPALREELMSQYTRLATLFSHELHILYPQLGMAAAQELSGAIVALIVGHGKLSGSLQANVTRGCVLRGQIDRLIHSYVMDPPSGTEAREDSDVPARPRRRATVAAENTASPETANAPNLPE